MVCNCCLAFFLLFGMFFADFFLVCKCLVHHWGCKMRPASQQSDDDEVLAADGPDSDVFLGAAQLESGNYWMKICRI